MVELRRPASDRHSLIAHAMVIGTELLVVEPGRIRAFAIASGRLAYQHELGGAYTCAARGHDGRSLLLGFDDGSVHRFDVPTRVLTECVAVGRHVTSSAS